MNKRKMQGFCRRIAAAGCALACLPMPLFGQSPAPVQLQESSNILLGLVIVAVALLVVTGVLLAWRRRKNASSGRHAYPDPPLVFPIPHGAARAPAAFPQAQPVPDLPLREHAPTPPVEAAPPVVEPASASEPTVSRDEVPSRQEVAPPLPTNGAPLATPVVPVPAPVAEEAPPPAEEPLALPPVGENPGAANGAEAGEYVEGRTVRYYRPVDDTVQFLPGRLEIVEGEDRGQDIRFIRATGTVAEITFGRSSGPAHRHVQLRARTVSREHARLRYEPDGWRIGNLSQTNPVVVNGEELHSVQDTRALSDGDLIEMGEVVFRFRER